MRKGFILTLTALATAFMVTSAVALGPTVKPIPDVYISSAEEQVANPNTFRYSDAITLWQYVEAGVETGDGSTSDTLYWAWAAKAADLAGGSGAFLDSASTNYTIIQGNAVEAHLWQPTNEVGDTGWVAEVNNELTGLGASLSDVSLANAGALTFRDIRLSPLPEQASYPAPTAEAGAPAGTYGVQEATVYVSDTNTTPGTDTFLLVSVDDITAGDTLSGGAVFTMVQDYTSDTSAFAGAELSLQGNTLDSKVVPTIPHPTAVVTNPGTGSISYTFPVANATNTYGFAQSQPALSTAVQPGTLYRVTASLASSNSVATTNPSAILALNGRTSCGYGLMQVLPGNGPTVSSGPQQVSAYLVPTDTGTPGVQVAVYDPDSTVGGTLTFTGIEVHSVALAEVLGGATSVLTVDTFNVDTDWQSLSGGYAGKTSPVFTQSPSSGSAASVSITSSTNTHTGSSADQSGFHALEGKGAGAEFTTVPGKLYLIQYELSTSSGPTAQLPTTYLRNVEVGGGLSGGMLFDTTATGGLTNTPAPFYLVYEAAEVAGQAGLWLLADLAQISGNIIMSQVVVYEADVPSGP